MKNNNNILDLLKQYLENASNEEIIDDVSFVNSIGFDGISVSDYFARLGNWDIVLDEGITICDDIKHAQTYNNYFANVDMGDSKFVERFQNLIIVECKINSCTTNINDTESHFELAA
ncbi:MAG: hypothetical protein IPO63_16210 [Bacteroidetes bacterium]|nr:hypothetical protein [Bacteroidota bacterium]